MNSLTTTRCAAPVLVFPPVGCRLVRPASQVVAGEATGSDLRSSIRSSRVFDEIRIETPAGIRRGATAAPALAQDVAGAGWCRLGGRVGGVRDRPIQRPPVDPHAGADPQHHQLRSRQWGRRRVERAAAWRDVFRAIQPSVVYHQRRTRQVPVRTRRRIGRGRRRRRNGQILTASHVVAGADAIEVTFADGTRAPATIASEEPDNDIAVLAPAQLPSVVVPAVLGGGVQIGDDVYAIGHPFGLPTRSPRASCPA